MIDPGSDRALYRQIADILRTRILNGTLAPGTVLPSERHLGQEFEVGHHTIRRALAVLRAEGHVQTIGGLGTVVFAVDETIMDVDAPATLRIRRATDDERRRLEIAEGAPVAVIEHAGRVEVRAADNLIIEVHAAT